MVVEAAVAALVPTFLAKQVYTGEGTDGGFAAQDRRVGLPSDALGYRGHFTWRPEDR